MGLQAGLDVRHDLTLDSFVSHDDEGLFDLAASSSYEYCCLAHPTTTARRSSKPPSRRDRRSMHLLPPSPFDVAGCSDENLIGCVILTAEAAHDEDLVDHKQRLPMFQMLLIYNYEHENNRVLYTCTYSFDDNTTGSCWKERKLSFVTIRDNSVVDLWTKEGQNDDDWQCCELVKLGRKGISIAFFADNRGTLLIKQGDVFSIIDLQGKEVIPVYLEKDQGVGHFRGACYFLG
uniref:Uncharacterized protein n=1 Tax=Aegilops tauschii TaxID=37682 RepID=M8C4Y7_AEGTA